jgi:16S rRNA (cytidine1402-2'-O)-methyltransferase
MATPGRGRLLVVGTPLGNLGDLSPRAAEALRAADVVVAEDTRIAARLLAHVGVRKPAISYRDDSAAQRTPELLARLAAGETLALTTDAGMPGVSDPGAQLVAGARKAGHAVEVIPGPSAVTGAMALSGVSAPGFLFAGFLPARPKGERRAALQRLIESAAALGLPLVLYEAPHRIRLLLAELAETAPESGATLCRELTKLHEQVLSGSPAEVAADLAEARGEFTVVITGVRPLSESGSGRADFEALAAAAARMGLARRSIADLLRSAGMGRRDAYDLAGRAATGSDAIHSEP